MGRYIRQTLLKEIGIKGQEKLSKAKLAIVGCGGLGSIVAPYLAGAGIGQLLLIDGDTPEISNLHRQVIFKENEKSSKSAALKTHITSLNSDIKVLHINEMLSKKNIEILKQYDLIIECTDDMMTKYLVNDYCHINRIPMVYGAIYKFEGYVSTFENKSESSIHLRDVFPQPDLTIPSCSEVGVMNSIAGLIGILQANEALKFILKIGKPLIGKLLNYNVLTNEQMKLNLKKTWTTDLVNLYKNESYQLMNCTNNEISIELFLKNKKAYTLVSILEDDEHQNITESTIRMPLSMLNIYEWEETDTPTVFYCLTGKRSSALVQQLLEDDNELDIYSLTGGLKKFLKEKG